MKMFWLIAGFIVSCSAFAGPIPNDPTPHEDSPYKNSLRGEQPGTFTVFSGGPTTYILNDEDSQYGWTPSVSLPSAPNQYNNGIGVSNWSKKKSTYIQVVNTTLSQPLELKSYNGASFLFDTSLGKWALFGDVKEFDPKSPSGEVKNVPPHQ